MQTRRLLGFSWLTQEIPWTRDVAGLSRIPAHSGALLSAPPCLAVAYVLVVSALSQVNAGEKTIPSGSPTCGLQAPALPENMVKATEKVVS